MKARKIFSGLLCFMLALLLLLSGCEQKSDQDNDQAPPNAGDEASSDGVGLEYGFDSGAGCESPPFYSAYRSDVNEFDINAVTLEFCYGGYYPLGSEYALNYYGASYPNFELRFTDTTGKSYFIKSVDENFISEKYRCYIEHIESDDTERPIEKIKYNHSETITIPSEIFSSEYGEFWFEVWGVNTKLPDSQMKCLPGAGAPFFYKIIDGKVILSSKPFE